MRQISSFYRSSLSEKWLFLKVTLLVSAIWIGLRVLPFKVLHSWLQKAAGLLSPGIRKVRNHPAQADALKICQAVDRAGRNFLGKDSCFPQALSGELLLRRNGYQPILRIGVLKEGERQIKAHAWVELEGKVVIGGPQSRVDKYSPLPNLD